MARKGTSARSRLPKEPKMGVRAVADGTDGNLKSPLRIEFCAAHAKAVP